VVGLFDEFIDFCRNQGFDGFGVGRAMAVFCHSGDAFVAAFPEDTQAGHVAEQVVVVASYPGGVPAVGRFELEWVIHYRLARQRD
jgi:hypothetical protein